MTLTASILAPALLVSMLPTAQKPEEAPKPARPVTDALEPVFRDMVPKLLERFGEPGLALAVIENGEVTVCTGFGMADKEAGTPVDGDTLFNVGSISKSVTAWTVMRLVAEDSKLELDSPVEDVIESWSPPTSPYDSSAVTIRRLLNHTAGLSLPSIPGYDLGEALPSLEEEIAAHVRIESPPGAKHIYSGGGTMLVQALVEQRTGSSFADAAQELVLAPLGMDSSRFGYAPSIAERCATPYTRLFEEGRDDTGHARWRHRQFVGVSGAALYTSARDLGRFLAAHCDTGPEASPGRGVLAPKAMRSMWQATASSPGYGLGYELLPPFKDRSVIMHGGSNHGWKSTFMLIPELGLGIAVLTNTDGTGARMQVLRTFRDAIAQ